MSEWNTNNNVLILASPPSRHVSFLTTERDILCLDYMTGLTKSPAHILPYAANSWTLKVCWSKTDIPKYSLPGSLCLGISKQEILTVHSFLHENTVNDQHHEHASSLGDFIWSSIEKCKDWYVTVINQHSLTVSFHTWKQQVENFPYKDKQNRIRR